MVLKKQTAIFLIGSSPALLCHYNFSTIRRMRWVRLVAIVHLTIWREFPENIKKYFHQFYFAKRTSNSESQFCKSELEEIFLKEMSLDLNDEMHVFPFNEYNVLIAAELREKFNLLGDRFQAVLPFRNKLSMNQIAKKNGIRVPNHMRFDKSRFTAHPLGYFKEIESSIGLPFILKPDNAAGSLGVMQISHYEQFAKFKIDAISWCQEYVIEEFLSGRLFHVDMLIQNKQILSVYCGEYNLPLLDFKSKKNVGSIVLLPEHEFTKKILAYVSEYFSKLPLVTGLIHAELFYLSQTNEFVFLEAAARAGGAKIIPMYKKTFNINLLNADFYAKLNLNDALKIELKRKNKIKQYSAWCLIPQRQGRLTHLHYPDIQSCYEITWLYDIGHQLKNPDSLKHKAGSLFMWDSDYFKLKQDFFKLGEMNLICVEN